MINKKRDDFQFGNVFRSIKKKKIEKEKRMLIRSLKKFLFIKN